MVTKRSKNVLKIGTDLDGIFISLPPYISPRVIEFLYKNGFSFASSNRRKLHYVIPGYFEQKIRLISHSSFLRQLIKKNAKELKAWDSKNIDIYLISSRYNFLRSKTERLLNKYELLGRFKETYFNYENKQPHIFKEGILKKLNLDVFIDDDLSLLLYLAEKFPRIRFFWCSSISSDETLPQNITIIKKLSDIYKHIKIT